VYGSLTDTIQNGIAFFRQKGAWPFLRLVASKLGFLLFEHTLIFYKIDLKDIPKEAPAAFDLQIASIEDIEKEDSYENSFFSKKQAIYRLRLGHRLFVLKSGDKIAYYCWVEQEKAAIWWFGLSLDLPKEVVYLSGTYTLPAFRGQGIAQRGQREILRRLKPEGVQFAFAAVHPDNLSPQKILKKSGFKEYQTVTYKRYWQIRHVIVTKAGSSTRRSYVRLFSFPKGIWRAFWD